MSAPYYAGDSVTLTRPRIGCINWSHEGAPKALVFVPTALGSEDAFFDTWAEAVAWANRYAHLWANREERWGADR